MQFESKVSFSLKVITIVVLTASVAACTQTAEDKIEINRLKEKIVALEAENRLLKQLPTSNLRQLSASKPSLPLPSPTVGKQPTAASVSPEVVVNDLTDVPQQALIEDLLKLGILSAPEGKFRPYDRITRGEYVTWLYKANNKLRTANDQIHLCPPASPFFKDLSTTHPCFSYAQALANAGYSVGYEDGTFRADQPLSREEMLGIKLGVDCGKNIEPYRSQMEFVWKFSDGKQVDERYTGYIHQDYYVSGPHGSNMMRAFGKIGTLHPKQAVTRAEAAGTLWQIGQFGHNGGTTTAALANTKG